MFLKFSFLPGCLPKLRGMALQENKGGFENLSPPSSNAYLKGHHFPLVAAIIKAQVINCFFVIINCEGSPQSRNCFSREGWGERESKRESHLSATRMPVNFQKGEGRGHELSSMTTFISGSWAVEMSSQV